MFSIMKYGFTAIGLMLLFAAFSFYQDTQAFLETAVTSDGTVVELISVRSDSSTTYKPLVEFETRTGELIEFTTSSSSNPPSYYKGEPVEVLYQEHAPRNAQINNFSSLWLLTLILAGIGFVLFLIGFLIIFFGRLKSKKKAYLMKNGVAVKAKIKSIEINRSLVVNGSSPYNIYTEWKNPSASEIHIFKSDNIWFDPTDYIEGDEITVLIEQDNPKTYYVDLSFLPVVHR